MFLRAEPLAGRNGHEAGRELLAEMYRQYCGKALPPILVTERGKPYLENDDLHFSISHTKRHVFCALSSVPVGVDAEEEDRDIDLRLAEKILSANEYAQYARATDPRMALLTFWVLKEADAKRTGLGLQGYPKHTDFSLDDPRVQRLEGCIVAVLEDGK